MAMLKPDSFSIAQRGLALGERLDQVLGLLLEATDTRIGQLAVTNISTDPGLQKDFPVKGAQRWVLHRIASGGTVLFAAATPTDILKGNVNRLGGLISNFGAVPVILTLASAATDASQEGLGEIAIPAGGTWNFKLSEAVWCGEINAEAIGGEGKITVTEI